MNYRNNRTGYAAVMAKAVSASKIEKNQLDFGDALAELKNADPDGWEIWYDNNMPDQIDWVDDEMVKGLCCFMLDYAADFATDTVAFFGGVK